MERDSQCLKVHSRNRDVGREPVDDQNAQRDEDLPSQIGQLEGGQYRRDGLHRSPYPCSSIT